MSYKPALPLAPSEAVRALVADGWGGDPLVTWPKGPEHRPRLRVLLRATARDATGAAHPFLHVAGVALPGPRDLTLVATARLHNREEAPKELAYLDDGDGGLFAAPPAAPGPGHARDVALRELDHLAARLLGPDPAEGGRVSAEPYHAALAEGCPVVTLRQAEAEGLPTLDALRAGGVSVRETDASALAARAALAIARAFAWTGDAIALPARLPHWNLSCDGAGRVRLSCRLGDPRELDGWSAAAAFGLAEGERALAAAKAVAARAGSRTVTVEGEAEIIDPGCCTYDGSRETASAMAEPLRRLLRKVRDRLDDPAREAADAILATPAVIPDAASAAGWWTRWSALSETLPDEAPEGSPDLRRLHLARLVLDACGHAGPRPAMRAEPAPEPDPAARAAPIRGDAAALAASARLVLAGLEFSVLAQTEAVRQEEEPYADVLRETSAVAADLMPYLATGGERYRTAWEAVLQAGIALRARHDVEGLLRLAAALDSLWDEDPETFPDLPAAARWAMELRPRQRGAMRACATLVAREGASAPSPDEPALSPPEPAVAVTVRRRAPPPRAPGRGRPGAIPVPDPIPVAAGPEPGIGPEPPVPEPSAPSVAPVEDARAEETEFPAVPVPETPVRRQDTVSPDGGPPDTGGATPEPDPTEAEAPAPIAGPDGRPAPTRNGILVIEAMRGRAPLRKTDIAVIAGIGRGAANRTVDRLVAEGWMVPDGPNLYRLSV